MKSAGNDIVALNAIDIQRTRDARFYSKFITDSELAIYQQQSQALSFEIFVWLLWSVKESAYKYLQRHKAGMIFSPAKIVIQQINVPTNNSLTNFFGAEWESDYTFENFYSGTVTSGSHQLYFRSKLHHEFIASVVNGDDRFENVYWGIRLINNVDSEHQSRAVRELVLTKLQSMLGVDDLQISKSETGYPVVLNSETSLDIAISFAHHDKWVGYSFAL